MTHSEPKISALGERAIVVEFGRSISVDLNLRAVSLSNYLEENPFPGFIASAPAYASTLIEFDPRIVRSHSDTDRSAFDCVADAVMRILPILREVEPQRTEPLEVPIRFGRDDGPDLEHVADHHGLAVDDVVRIFLSRTYRVYMVGFLPGFAYLGELDDRIARPRRETPRLVVPKGSVGIADRQTGIYPMESPGGWQLIGRTDVELFKPESDPPCMVSPGDQIRFTIA
jgi:inhibitor of KinA